MLQGGLHRIPNESVVSDVGVERPSVLLLSLRLGGSSRLGSVGGLGLVALVLLVTLFGGEVLLILTGLQSGGGAGGGGPSSRGGS